MHPLRLSGRGPWPPRALCERRVCWGDAQHTLLGARHYADALFLRGRWLQYTGKVHYVEIDIEADAEIAEAAGVSGTPTVQAC